MHTFVKLKYTERMISQEFLVFLAIFQIDSTSSRARGNNKNERNKQIQQANDENNL